MSRTRSLRSALILGAILVLILLGLSLASLMRGEEARFTLGEIATWVGIGSGEPLTPLRATILELLLQQTLVAAGVGAALAYSGALLQGLFRNGLASPSVLGLSAGASLGATLAILFVGGYYSDQSEWLTVALENSPLVVSAGAFAGGFGVALLVALIGGGAGRVSVPTLLLVGIAVNACLNGAITALIAWMVEHDWQISRAVLHWNFGSLHDKSWTQVWLVWGGVLVAASVYPFVARELDLFASGEEDAEAMGVNTRRIKLIVLVTASFTAASAVAVAGQIAFIGLIVPHLVRIGTGNGHRTLLPICLLGGAVFLLAADVCTRWFLGEVEYMRPGVICSILGGPFFLGLLVAKRKEVRSW